MNFITLGEWHINICQITVFNYDSEYRKLKVWTTECEDSLVMDDPDMTWYAKLCKAVGVDYV